jgi:hypothetical protein
MIVRRILLSVTVLAVLSAAVLFGAHQLLTPKESGLAGMMPGGALFYIESPDFQSLFSDWSNSPEKQAWLKSDNYAVFSQSRLFGRLSQAQSEFASAAGLQPDMQFVAQVAGKQSALAWYDIGELEFLYITRLPSATFTQSTLWQSRSKFAQRQSGKFDFYMRTDAESKRTVCFAAVDDLVILGTREDLVANALALIGGAQAQTLRDDPWYADAVTAAKTPGDLRMVLNLEKLVPLPYFRSYWIQQNITDMKQYRAAVSDLYRSKQIYREERVLLRKISAADSAISGDISPLAGVVPAGTGFYKAVASPSSQATLEILRDKLLDPRPHSEATYTFAPAAPAIDQIVGQASDFETRIDLAPTMVKQADPWQPMRAALDAAGMNGLLDLESSASQGDNVFVRFHSAIVLSADRDWNVEQIKAILASTLKPQLTTSRLGLGWIDKKTYLELDGLSPLFLYDTGKYLILANDPAPLLAVKDRLRQKPASGEVSVYASGFDHAQEGSNFRRISLLIDRANMRAAPSPSDEADDGNQPGRTPAFFSGNVAGFSRVFSEIASESIVTRNAGQNVTQTVTYQWR